MCSIKWKQLIKWEKWHNLLSERFQDQHFATVKRQSICHVRKGQAALVLNTVLVLSATLRILKRPPFFHRYFILDGTIFLQKKKKSLNNMFNKCFSYITVIIFQWILSFLGTLCINWFKHILLMNYISLFFHTTVLYNIGFRNKCNTYINPFPKMYVLLLMVKHINVQYIWYISLSYLSNHPPQWCNGKVLVLNVVDRGFQPQSDQT